MNAILQIVLTLVGVSAIYFVSASVVLPYFVQRRLQSKKVLEQLEDRTIKATERRLPAIINKTMDNFEKRLPSLIEEKVPEIAVALMEDPAMYASLVMLGDKFMDHAEKVMAGKLGVDAKQMKAATTAIQNFATNDGQNPVGTIIQDIAEKAGKGEDINFKQLLLKLALPYLPGIMAKFSSPGGGMGGRPAWLGP